MLVLALVLALPAPTPKPAPNPPAAIAGDPSASVVKITARQRVPDFLQPWTRESPTESTGSGVVIDGERILTNAHVVRWATRIEVQPSRSSKKYNARVVGFASSVDLALLEITEKSDELFADRAPLPMDPELPRVSDSVTVYGYPVGGTDLSVTEGIVSRIEYGVYGFERNGRMIQIDAALNPGNSGGPAVVDGRMTGIAFGMFGSGNDIGYLIPAYEILAFLADVADGSYEGQPQLFDQFQTLENEALRARLGLDDGVTGLAVTSPASAEPDYPLRSLDVVTHIGEHDIQNDGKVEFRDDLRLEFQALVPDVAREGVVPLTVVRAGESREVRVPVTPSREQVIPTLGDGTPSYFIHGPLLFTTVYSEWAEELALAAAGALIYTRNPIVSRLPERTRFPGESMVVLFPTLFDHPLTTGYAAPEFWVVDEVDGVPVENLAHLWAHLWHSRSRYVEFTFRGLDQETLVFEREALGAATQPILEENGIREERSHDLMEDPPEWVSKRPR